MTKKISTISDEEKELFRNAVANTKPLKFTERNLSEKTKKITVKKPIEYAEQKIQFDFSEKQPDITGEDIILFSQSGVQHKRLSQLRQGKMKIEATLDLHQHTGDEAILKTEAFLKHCKNRGFKTVCIIHGKGNYSSGNKPILKNLLNDYLRHHPLVLAFHSAKSKDGGAGALYVLIKSKI